MKHIAIDLGGRESQICVRDQTGQIVEEGKSATSKLGQFLQKQSKSRVVLEASSEAFFVADAALKAGHEVRVVAATLAPALGVGSRGVKNDRKDARVLSEASTRVDLPSIHIPSQTSRELKAFCASREATIRARTLIVNVIRSWARTIVLGLGGTPETLSARVLEATAKTDSPCPPHIEAILVTLDHLNEQIKSADRELKQLAQASAVCRLLMTVPGVGPVTAVRFLAVVDDVARFENAHALESYVGLTPGQKQSSSQNHKTGLTKAGSPRLRWTVVQAAWSAYRTRPNDPMVLWAKEIQKRRGKMIAVVALARKLIGILYAIWRDQQPYDPRKGAAAMTVSQEPETVMGGVSVLREAHQPLE